MALGGTRFAVARKVVFPFAKGGIIGGTMLALGRALGETAAVLIIVSPEYVIKPRILEAGTQPTSALIAGYFGDATKAQLSALLTAGFVLFLITFVVNSGAAVFIRRSPAARHGDLSRDHPARGRDPPAEPRPPGDKCRPAGRPDVTRPRTGCRLVGSVLSSFSGSRSGYEHILDFSGVLGFLFSWYLVFWPSTPW